VRPDRDAGEQVAYDRRQAEAHRQQAEHEREADTRGDGSDEAGLVRHGRQT
jgi:hypothetical protein